ncbi:hypothetical protein HNY73_001534 [Argiope bruennichi]|uniref:Uncharacterized protein n=1 Tax=Argiope bruennichi TaxID=94029 RepID=A0A8T0G5T9_ARGBR|nr:hypothetical protein HNY73_001534 [Argiope bruennichi]
MPNLRSEDFKGHEEETISLRLKIMELQKQIEELEGTSDKQKDGKITYQDGSKQRMKSSNISKKQDPTEKLVRDCVDLKAKLEYWKNRNKELEKLSGQVRLELDRFLDKSVENKRIQSEYAGLERELRARQAEKLEMRCKLDNAKTRNCQLSDELSLIREDVERIRNKTEDDNMLLEALTKDSFFRLNEWQEQLRQSKATSAQKKAEIRDLQESIKTLEGLAASKGAKLEAGKEDSSSTLDELLIKLDIEKEVHRFMIGHWKAVVAKTDGLFQIYATGADRTTKLFIDSLREKKKSFEKQPSAEEIKPRSSHTENDQQST